MKLIDSVVFVVDFFCGHARMASIEQEVEGLLAYGKVGPTVTFPLA